MKCWLIYSKADAEKNASYIGSYIDEGKLCGIDIELIYTETLLLGVHSSLPCCYISGKRYTKGEECLPAFSICRTINPDINRHLEAMGIPVYNNSMVASICNDKAATYRFLSGRGIPMMDTYVPSSEDMLPAYPFVMKSCSGHGGSEVFLVHSHDEYISAKMKLTGKAFVIQQLCNVPGVDLRVYVLGKEIVAAVRRENPNGFKSNYSLGGNAYLHTLTEEENRYARQIISLFDFGLAGIDFIYHNDHPVFNEIEDVVGARMLYANMDINLPRMYLNYIQKDLLVPK